MTSKKYKTSAKSAINEYQRSTTAGHKHIRDTNVIFEESNDKSSDLEAEEPPGGSNLVDRKDAMAADLQSGPQP